MGKKVISIKTVVAIGIGAALMFVLMRFVAVPSGVPNTNLNLGIGILSIFAAIFGPVAGFLIGFIGHTLTDLTWGGMVDMGNRRCLVRPYDRLLLESLQD